MANQVDVLLSQIGTGKWNLFHFITTGFATGMPAPHALAGAFVVPRLDNTCQPNVITNEEATYVNTTTKNTCSYWIKTEDDDLLKEEQCSQWDFDNSTFSNTMTSEFDLVCQKAYVRALYSSLYMIGVLVGSPIIGYLSDRFGRKSTFVIGMIGFTVLSLISGWLPNVTSILIFRFLIGICHVPVVKIAYILGMEATTPESRAMVGVMLYLPWTFYTIALSGVAYFIRDWRWLVFTASLTNWTVLPALWFIDESPHWLVVRGQYDRALQVLKKAARWNKATLPSDDDIIYRLKEHNAEAQKAKPTESQQSWKQFLWNVFILFRTPRLRTATIVMHLGFFVTGMVFFGLAFSGGSSFNMDPFSFLALMGVLELPGQLFMSPVVSRIGRKIPFVFGFIFSGIMLLCTAFVPKGMNWLVVIFTVFGRLNICVANTLIYLYGSELFPTEVRTRGISYSFVMSRVGASTAPFITEYLGQSYPWAPSVVFGCLALTAGLASLTLWETMGKALPDTIATLESQDLSSGGCGIFKRKKKARITSDTNLNGITPEKNGRINEGLSL